MGNHFIATFMTFINEEKWNVLKFKIGDTTLKNFWVAPVNDTGK